MCVHNIIHLTYSERANIFKQQQHQQLSQIWLAGRRTVGAEARTIIGMSEVFEQSLR